MPAIQGHPRRSVTYRAARSATILAFLAMSPVAAQARDAQERIANTDSERPFQIAVTDFTTDFAL